MSSVNLLIGDGGNFHEVVQFFGKAETPEELLVRAGNHVQLQKFLDYNQEQFDRRDIESLRNIQATLIGMLPEDREAAGAINRIDSVVNAILYRNPLPDNLVELIIKYDPSSGEQIGKPIVMDEKTVARMEACQAEYFGRELCQPRELTADELERANRLLTHIPKELDEMPRSLTAEEIERAVTFLKHASPENRHAFFHSFFTEILEKFKAAAAGYRAAANPHPEEAAERDIGLGSLINRALLLIWLLPEDLKTFDLTGCLMFDIEDFLSHVGYRCPNLQVLNLNGCKCLTYRIRDLDYFENLEELSMRSADQDPDAADSYWIKDPPDPDWEGDITNLAKRTKSLKRLDIRGNIDPSPENIAAIRAEMKRAREKLALNDVEVLIAPEDSYKEPEEEQKGDE